jgi:DNA invertase Pin-like site-specific DNA recombinase
VKTTKAVSYLRVSGKGQVDGDGFPRQRDAIARYARQHGIEVSAEYRDEGVSGTRDLENRDGLRDLITRLRTNGVRLVLVENATRLARDLMVSEIILRECRELGVSVIAADSGTDLTVGDDDPTRKLIRQVLGAVAEFEKSVLVAKLRAARVRKRRTQGRCEGRKPYGARVGESDVIERILTLRRKPRKGARLSFAGIAATLNAENAPTRTGRPWAAGTVRQIAMRRPMGNAGARKGVPTGAFVA